MSRVLPQLDPRAVPLPNGTEVSTRVDRDHAGRRVPQGAVGRVVATEGDTVDVAVVGVGVLRYSRAEVLPRKQGQIRYARRRAAAWDALVPCAVLVATVGSRAWGLAHEGSDEDLRGAFALPFPWTNGLVEPPQDLIRADGSESYWEVGKLIRQGLRADPNTLEALFVQDVRPLDEIGAWILESRHIFVSREVYSSFGRYALSQLKRLESARAMAEHREVVLSWLEEEPAPTLDEVAERLAPIAAPRAPRPSDALLLAKEYIKALYRSLYDQGLLSRRDYSSLIDFARNNPIRFELPKELRPKNAYNLLRLLYTALEWLRTGEADLVMRGAPRTRLLQIKEGHVALSEVLAEAEALTVELEEARARTPLPAAPDFIAADALLQRIRAELARRWLTRAAGPWGVHAPPAPLPFTEEEPDDPDPDPAA